MRRFQGLLTDRDTVGALEVDVGDDPDVQEYKRIQKAKEQLLSD